MVEYIKREDIFPNGVFYVNESDPSKSLDELILRIDNLPAADVVEVRHGEWVVCGTFDDFITCSVCKSNKYPFGYDFKYCPECGAKMDGGKTK